MKTVQDIMHRDVVTVGPDTTVRELARVLSDGEISGAPVVDRTGRVMGVVSATDVLRLAAEGPEVELEEFTESRPLRAGLDLDPEDDLGDQGVDYVEYYVDLFAPMAFMEGDLVGPQSALDQRTVTDIMTPAQFTVRPDATVEELAEFMWRGRIHRALVVENGQLQGIVTTFDVMRAVAEGL